MMFLTFGMSFTPRCTLCETILKSTLAVALVTPSMPFSASSTCCLMVAIWLCAG